MFGIAIRASEIAQNFWRMVDRASTFEVEPSILTLGYAPHLTLARYDEIDAAKLGSTLDVFEGTPALKLVFDRICTFDSDPLILWLAPRPEPRLIEIHGRVHESLGMQRSDPHYRPGVWQPHCTIATAISMESRPAAQAFASEPIEPFTITFDFADALEWPPVVRVGTRRLV